MFAGELGLAYTATDAVVFDVGARGLWQRGNQPIGPSSTPRAAGTTGPTGAAGFSEATIVQGLVFVGVTLRAPAMRF